MRIRPISTQKNWWGILTHFNHFIAELECVSYYYLNRCGSNTNLMPSSMNFCSSQFAIRIISPWFPTSELTLNIIVSIFNTRIQFILFQNTFLSLSLLEEVSQNMFSHCWWIQTESLVVGSSKTTYKLDVLLCEGVVRSNVDCDNGEFRSIVWRWLSKIDWISSNTFHVKIVKETRHTIKCIFYVVSAQKQITTWILKAKTFCGSSKSSLPCELTHDPIGILTSSE